MRWSAHHAEYAIHAATKVENAAALRVLLTAEGEENMQRLLTTISCPLDRVYDGAVKGADEL